METRRTADVSYGAIRVVFVFVAADVYVFAVVLFARFKARHRTLAIRVAIPRGFPRWQFGRTRWLDGRKGWPRRSVALYSVDSLALR